jgi:hypothetical protein
MSFLIPSLLGFLVLASVPIIIHLLNRRRFMRVDWAPMKYLKLTIKTNRRRLRIEQIILLALRTLAIIVLICAIARPVLSSTGLGAWLSGRSRTSRILVIDDSLSMGYQVDRRPAFELAKAVAGELVRKIGTQDAVTAFVTSNPQSTLVREAHLEDPNKLIAELAKLSVSDARSDWGGTFKAIDQYLAAAAFPVKEVTLITDLRKSGWGAQVTDAANRWAGQGVSQKVIDVGTRQTANTVLAALELEDPIVLPGADARLRASVRNDTPNPITGAHAVLTIGDQSRPVVLPDLPAGQTTEVPLTVSLPKPGQVPVRLTLPNDPLPGDNDRWLAVTVRQSLELSLVDGEPSAQPFESATDFLALAFSIGSEPWHAERRSDTDWGATRITTAPDVITLANVSSLSPERIADLERLVRDGTGLMIFCGELVDPVLYNQRLYRDGLGLLPARLDKPIDGPVTGLVVEPLAQSPLAALSRIAPAALARIQARRFMAAAVPGGAKSEDVRILARWNDPEGHPAVIEKRFGKGRVILWTVSANKQWSDWPIDPTYVLAVRSAAMAIARAEPQQDNVTAGDAIQYVLPEGQAATEAKAAAPGRETPETASIVKPEHGPSIIRAVQTTRAGPYLMTWKNATGGAEQHLFCVNGDKAESDLTPLPDAELTALLGNLRPVIVHYTAGSSALTQQGKEVWRTFATCLLALLAVETVFAVWVGRER